MAWPPSGAPKSLDPLRFIDRGAMLSRIPPDLRDALQYTCTRGPDGLSCRLCISFRDVSTFPPRIRQLDRDWQVPASEVEAAERHGAQELLMALTRARGEAEFLALVGQVLRRSRTRLTWVQGELVLTTELWRVVVKA